MNDPRAVAIFGSSRTEPGSPDWDDAEDAGGRLAGAGLTVVTGGYGGVMEAASKGAAATGGRVVGITAPGLFPDRAGANPYVTHEIPATSLEGRIGALTQIAAAALVLPGSIGTAAELVIAWNLNHIARVHGGPRFPTAAIGDGWRKLWRLLCEELGAARTDVALFDTVGEGVDWLLEQPELVLA